MLFSINIPQIATPELSVEDARCYIVFFREGASLSAYVGLYLPRTDRRFYYTFAANPFPFEALSDVDDEARRFAEEMGFLLDEINIGSMSLEERSRWFDEQAIFGAKKPPEEKPALQSASAAQAPAEQPKPAPQPEEPPAPAVQPAAEPRPAGQPEAPPAQPVAAAPEPSPQQAPPIQPPPRKKPAPVRQATQPKPKEKAETLQAEPLVAEPEPRLGAVDTARPDDVIQQAVKAGVVKSPKPKLKHDIRSSAGVVNRDLEALVRLLASF